MSVEQRDRAEPVVGGPERQAVTEFLYQEAALLDAHRSDEWLQLCTDDVVYWIPSGMDSEDPENGLSLAYDNRHRLERRVERLTGRWVFSQDPPQPMTRLVSNVQIGEWTAWCPPSAVKDVPVTARFHVVEARRGNLVNWVGVAEYRLRGVGEDGGANIRISYKKVTLVNRDTELPVLAFIL